ncbi:MAG: tetratricopeptide repeat protein [Verrucomicrobia bacterium]|nr:tetratricopeptide repeat protein [Verrucomicrobiota bacterium]
MNPVKTNDQPILVNRWMGVRPAGFLIKNGMNAALSVFTAYCVVATSPHLQAAEKASSAATQAEVPQDRAEVYVDGFIPPNPRLNLLENGHLRGEALAHYSLAWAYEGKKDLDRALQEYREVLRLMPGNVKLAQRVAYLLASGGRKEEARGVMQKTLGLNPDDPSAYINFSEYLLTYHAESRPDRERAVALAEEALAKFQDIAAVYQHVVRLYLVGRQAAKAKAAINKALKQSSQEPQFWLDIATIAQRVWPLNTSEGQEPVLLNNIYQKVLDHSKNKESIQEAVAGFYHSSHQPEKARELYEKIVSAHPDQLDVRKKLASVYQVLGQQDKVIETLRTVLRIDPRDVLTNKLLAEVYRERKDWDNAARYLQQALKISKGSESEYLDLAQLLLAARRPADGVPLLERATYYYPKDPRLTFLLAISHTGAKQYDASLSAFEKTIQLGKETQPGLLNDRFYFQYGAAAERAGNLDQAADLFRKTMELLAKTGGDDDETKAFTAQVYNYLGYMWLENDMHVEEAGELIKTAFNLTPKSGAIRDSLGWFYFKKRQFEEARRELTLAVEMMEEPDSVVFDHLAQTYFQLGMKPEALENMRKALELDSSNKDFAERLKKFETETPPVPRPLPKSSPPLEKKDKSSPKAVVPAGKAAA